MLVILRENVENLGRIGDIVKVSPGYARNFLLPRKLVVIADEANKVAIEHHRKTLEKRRQAAKAQASGVAAQLSELQVTISRKVGENDKLFGSVTSQDIAEALKAQNFKVEKRWIHIDAPIKSLGVHTVAIRLEPEVSANVKIWVVKET